MSATHTLEFKHNKLLPLLFGEHNSHLNYLEEKLGIQISDRGNTVTLSGDNVAVKTAENVLNALWTKIEKKHDIGTAEIDAELRFLQSNGTKKNGRPAMSKHDTVIKTKKKSITARSPNQEAYLNPILNHYMEFGLDAAGSCEE